MGPYVIFNISLTEFKKSRVCHVCVDILTTEEEEEEEGIHIHGEAAFDGEFRVCSFVIA